MDKTNSNTIHRKFKHLTFEERVIIQLRLEEGKSPNAIAKEIGCASNTIRNEIKRGLKLCYHGKVKRYKADIGQAIYEENRLLSRRNYDVLAKDKFIKYVEYHFKEEGWSLDACVGYALTNKEFDRNETVCTKTLYNYVDLGLIDIKNMDLPERLKRTNKRVLIRKNKRKLGRSIEERDSEINERKEFGHWEADLILGSKNAEDDAILTLLERKTRQYLMVRVPGREPSGIMTAIDTLRNNYKEQWDKVFKTITTDNGSEFALLSQIEETSNTKIYFTHPYTSCEKGSIERHNGFVRRFLPKGKRIKSFSDEQISNVEIWCNNLPRKLLKYKTPDALFEEELDNIYNSAA